MEENVHTGGIGQQISDILVQEGVVNKFLNCSIPNEFIEHGDVESLKKLVGIDEETIYTRIMVSPKHLSLQTLVLVQVIPVRHML